MTFVSADPVSIYFFEAFSLVMFLILVLAVWKTSKRRIQFLFYFAGYILVFCAVVAIGLPKQYPIPVIPILFLSVLVGALVFAFSAFGKQIGAGFSLATLTAFQAFRLPLELLLHHWAEIGTIPSTMTWTGQNWDVISGVLALVFFPFVHKSKNLALFVHVLSFLLLLNVIRVVVMSSPFPFSWKIEYPMQLILYLPYALIGPLFVGAAFAGHFIAFRVLLKK